MDADYNAGRDVAHFQLEIDAGLRGISKLNVLIRIGLEIRQFRRNRILARRQAGKIVDARVVAYRGILDETL